MKTTRRITVGATGFQVHLKTLGADEIIYTTARCGENAKMPREDQVSTKKDSAGAICKVRKNQKQNKKQKTRREWCRESWGAM